MNDRKIVIALLAVIGAGAALLAGCASTVKYGDAADVEPLTTDFGAKDLQTIAAKMVDSLLAFPPIVQATAARRPVLVVDKVKNKTTQHVDTESITDTIRAQLLRSGKFRFLDRTTDAQTIAEIRRQQEQGLTKPSEALQFGQQEAAEYMLTANLSEIEEKAGRKKSVYYKFTMNLKNLTTGILEWSDEKQISKLGKKSLLGW